MNSEKIIKHLLYLQTAYARIFRVTVTNERLRNAIKNREGTDLSQERLREPLLEHIGHLPIIATFLHSHIHNHEKVNLGRVLVMLAIHDIGEIVTGDVVTFRKTKEGEEKEDKEAKKLLSKDLIDYYDELNLGQTFDAKFAWAVDTIGPFLYELESPNMTRKRFSDWNITSKIIEEKKKQYFEWDPILLDMFNVFVSVFRDIEDGKTTIFAQEPDLPTK